MEQENSLRDYFDKWAKEYQGNLNTMPAYLDWSFGEISKRIPKKKGSVISDLGTGNGRLITFLNRKDCSYIGEDISPEQLRLAYRNTQKNNLDTKFICANLNEEVPFNPKTIDYFVSNAALHHIENKDFLFERLYDSLKPDGKLIFFDFYFHVIRKGYEQKIKALNRTLPEETKLFKDSIEEEYLLIPDALKKSHPREFHINPNKLKSILKGAGFSEIEIIPSLDERYIGFSAQK